MTFERDFMNGQNWRVSTSMASTHGTLSRTSIANGSDRDLDGVSRLGRLGAFPAVVLSAQMRCRKCQLTRAHLSENSALLFNVALSTCKTDSTPSTHAYADSFISDLRTSAQSADQDRTRATADHHPQI